MPVLTNPRREMFCQHLQRLLGAGGKLKDARDEAYRLAGYEVDQKFLTDNARKLAQQPAVKARMAELAAEVAKISVLDAGWALTQLKADFEAVGSFNLNDYLRRDGDGQPYFDLSGVSAAKMALLTELALETVFEGGAKDQPPDLVRKIKLKGPSKYPERVAILGLMARIGGWEAPRKVAPTDPTGKKGATVTLESLIAASYESPKDEEQAA